jgi:hypothetical protein
MKYLSLLLCSCLMAISISSCGKKNDAPGGADSTKKADSIKQTSSTTTPSSSTAATPAESKYPIKSGIIHSEQEMMGMKIKTTKYFDDYGAKNREDIESNMDVAGQHINNHQIKIMKEGWLYSYDLKNKQGSKMKFTIPAAMDFKNMGVERMKQMGVKQTGTETILGKECKIYEFTDAKASMGMTGKSWIFWNSEPMKMNMDMGNKMSIKQHVTSIEENAPITADKFEIPGDIKITEMGSDMKPIMK